MSYAIPASNPQHIVYYSTNFLVLLQCTRIRKYGDRGALDAILDTAAIYVSSYSYVCVLILLYLETGTIGDRGHRGDRGQLVQLQLILVKTQLQKYAAARLTPGQSSIKALLML